MAFLDLEAEDNPGQPNVRLFYLDEISVDDVEDKGTISVKFNKAFNTYRPQKQKLKVSF